jgi:DNA-binding NarL/FixJ family response regulator
VAVIDIRMPPTHTDEGLRAALQLRREHRDVGVLLFSQYVELRYATELLAAVERHRPDVAVVDVRMPPTHTDEGLRAAVAIRTARPGAPVLVLSQYVEVSYADDLLADGRGIIANHHNHRLAHNGAILDALARVAAGGTVLDPEVVAQLLVLRRSHDRLGPLTPREREVLALMAEGRSNTAIARALVVTEGAVEKHVANIFAKLGLPPDEDSNRRVLAVLAFLRP